MGLEQNSTNLVGFHPVRRRKKVYSIARLRRAKNPLTILKGNKVENHLNHPPPPFDKVEKVFGFGSRFLRKPRFFLELTRNGHSRIQVFRMFLVHPPGKLGLLKRRTSFPTG